jgi:tetratricopeptide (TPR) repeat protein
MENYFSNFLLTSELDNPKFFAKVHQNIYELEKQRIALFNKKGPLNWEYIAIMGELNMAYMEAKDTSNEVLTAQQIYRGTVALNGKDDSLSYEALLALGSSLVDDDRLSEAQVIATELLQLTTETKVSESEKDFDYLTYLDALCLQADIYHKKETFAKEEEIRRKVLDAYEDSFGAANDQTVMARAALAICLEKMKRYSQALEQYIQIRSYLDVEKELATEAERIGLMAHISYCYRKTGHFEDSSVVLQWAFNESLKVFGPEASLTTKMKALLSQ